jgi:hypothetical protein
MNLFVLFGDGGITRKFASCATRNDAVFHHFFPGDTPSPNKIINSFLKLFNIFIKNLGRCTSARNFKLNHQVCKLLQSTEDFGRSRKFFSETGPRKRTVYKLFTDDQDCWTTI